MVKDKFPQHEHLLKRNCTLGKIFNGNSVQSLTFLMKAFSVQCNLDLPKTCRDFIPLNMSLGILLTLLA